jgi:hypothetical protein
MILKRLCCNTGGLNRDSLYSQHIQRLTITSEDWAEDG